MLEKLIILLPFLSFIISGLCGFKKPQSLKTLPSFLISLSAVLACITFYEVIFKGQIKHCVISDWLEFAPAYKVYWAIYIDSTAAIMLAIITIISAIVHIYSIGYMEGKDNLPKFMAFLSLFTFFMLVLVTSDNIMQLFFGWEGVGLCSYFLIGYWNEKESACTAATKAFVINRVADAFFILGIIGVYISFGSLAFAEIFSQVPSHAENSFSIAGHDFLQIDFICLMLFIGCMGKSAQILFHTWLPDAMEGPTPASALIHAATMVAAGVFLVIRCAPLFEQSPIIRDFIVVVGSLTCIITAIVALTQNDIKKIIAYSTCSQLGYMFIACGLSAYTEASFHLMTHAFFKALLFLGAGSIMHAMSGEQNIQKMGSLYRKIPFSYLLMLIGTLSISGIFPFAGYFSKESILEAAYSRGSTIGKGAYILGVMGAFFTAFYSFRLLLLAFHGDARYEDNKASKVKESSILLLGPSSFLALGALFAGMGGAFFLQLPSHNLSTTIKILPSISALIGSLLAVLAYLPLPFTLRTSFKYKDKTWPTVPSFFNKNYVDMIYTVLIVRPMKKISLYLANPIEIRVIDGIGIHGLSSIIRKCAAAGSKLQSGFIYQNTLTIVLALIGMISWCFIKTFTQ